MGYGTKADQPTTDTNTVFEPLISTIEQIQNAYPDGIDQVQEFLETVYCSPPSLNDAEWKFVVVFYRALALSKS